jgi:hypothetical protein
MQAILDYLFYFVKGKKRNIEPLRALKKTEGTEKIEDVEVMGEC